MSLHSMCKTALMRPGYVLRRMRNRGFERFKDLYFRYGFEEKVVNENEYIILGMKRSGNHAVINWLERQSEGYGIHLNNLRLGENPFEYLEHARRKLNRNDAWMMTELERYEYFKGECGSNALAREARREFSTKQFLIHSYEDYSTRALGKNLTERRRVRFFGKSRHVYSLLVLRDPFNLVASRVQKGLLDVQGWRINIIGLWLEHAREFLGLTANLPNCIPINFNRWACDRAYRQTLADLLKVDFTDEGFDEVPQFGGGSSFDMRDFNGNASGMQVTERWIQFQDDPKFQAYFKHREIFAYVRSIFGEFHGLREFEKRCRVAR